MTTADELEAMRRLVDERFRALIRAQRDAEKRGEARRLHPVGSSRAKVTTLNARWASACEERDRQESRLADTGVDLDKVLEALFTAGLGGCGRG